jgi:hypothetical protein
VWRPWWPWGTVYPELVIAPLGGEEVLQEVGSWQGKAKCGGVSWLADLNKGSK